MKRTTLMLILFICLVLAQRMQAQGTITTFDAPGAGRGAGQDTFSVAINPVNATTGW